MNTRLIAFRRINLVFCFAIKSKWVRGILESHKVILKEALTVEIEKERKCLIETAFKEGFKSSNTIEISQFIDEMLNELEKIK